MEVIGVESEGEVSDFGSEKTKRGFDCEVAVLDSDHDGYDLDLERSDVPIAAVVDVNHPCAAMTRVISDRYAGVKATVDENNVREISISILTMTSAVLEEEKAKTTWPFAVCYHHLSAKVVRAYVHRVIMSSREVQGKEIFFEVMGNIGCASVRAEGRRDLLHTNLY